MLCDIFLKPAVRWHISHIMGAISLGTLSLFYTRHCPHEPLGVSTISSYLNTTLCLSSAFALLVKQMPRMRKKDDIPVAGV